MYIESSESFLIAAKYIHDKYSCGLSHPSGYNIPFLAKVTYLLSRDSVPLSFPCNEYRAIPSMGLQNTGMPLRSESIRPVTPLTKQMSGNANDFPFHPLLDFLSFGDRPLCWLCKAQITSSVQLSPGPQGSAVLGQCARDKCFRALAYFHSMGIVIWSVSCLCRELPKSPSFRVQVTWCTALFSDERFSSFRPRTSQKHYLNNGRPCTRIDHRSRSMKSTSTTPNSRSSYLLACPVSVPSSTVHYSSMGTNGDSIEDCFTNRFALKLRGIISRLSCEKSAN